MRCAAAQRGSVVADRSLAVQCLRRAAQAGHPDAQYRLAILLIGEEADPQGVAEARRWLESSARSMPESVYELALLNAESQPNAALARASVVEKAAAAGYPPAQYELARSLFAKGDNAGKQAAYRDLLNKAAEQRHGEAAAELALQLQGDARTEDASRIISLLTLGSSAGSARADHALALRYATADGVKRDTERAWQLARRSAAGGYAPSLYTVGFFLSHGVGVASDVQAALEWFRRAADRGNLDALMAIGNAYANGWGIGKSLDVAYKWYCKAAQAGHAGARSLVSRQANSECDLPAGHARTERPGGSPPRRRSQVATDWRGRESSATATPARAQGTPPFDGVSISSRDRSPSRCTPR